MKRILTAIAMVALAVPLMAAPFGHGSSQPGHDNHGGPGNHGGYNPGYPGGGSNPGFPGNPGGGSNPGFPGNPGGGYNPGHPGGGSNPGFPGNPGGGYNPGHPGGGYNPGHPGHGYEQQRLRESVRRIQGLFRLAEGAFRPGMDRREVMECARTLGMIEREIGDILDLVPMPAVRDLQGVRRIVGQARFTLVTDFNPREAHQLVRRASYDFDRITDRIFYR
ncbi:MAG: hypothetical protein GX442_10895 [Candidatus Riflebacteria bacterium]|nr:hypothetical protein [Candidatus Riflebacteria bacterium]